MNHHREGSGEPLVLIHGVGHHRQGWGPVIDRLAAHADVIAPDSPGFGSSPSLDPGVGSTIEAYAEAFMAFFAEIRVERPHVVGNSMGGGIALELARRGAARSVTAISPVGFWTPRERRFCQLSMSLSGAVPAPARPVLLALAGTAVGRTAILSQNFARPWRMPAEEARLMMNHLWSAPALASAVAAFSLYTFRDGESLRGVPVTIAWGTRDRLLPYSRQAPRARRALPDARHVTLQGLGHTPFFDDPCRVAEVILTGAGLGEPAK